MGVKPSSKNTDHRPKRDTQKTREMASLKTENHHLRRQVARLQKEVNRLEGVADDPNEASDSEPMAKLPQCKECQSTKLLPFTTPGGKTVTTCAWCGFRTTLTAA